MYLQQPLALSGSQDGTARLTQVQTKRVLATLSHDGVDPSVAGTVNDTTAATENSVEWYVHFLFSASVVHTLNQRHLDYFAVEVSATQ
jgi:hypothetical protein